MLGIRKTGIVANGLANDNYNYTLANDPVSNGIRGNTVYQLSNHLGNVMATITDRKIGVDVDNDGQVDHFDAEVLSQTDYYPFGMKMKDRSYGVQVRYGFNGMELENKIAKDSYDFGARIYDGRLGRWLSVDPLQNEYPMMTPFHFVSNSPIGKIDVDGRWDIEVHAYKNRARYGYAILIVKNVEGNEVYRTTVRVQGMKSVKNNNNPRNRKATFGDTPTGTYKIKGWSNRLSNLDRKVYGPNDVLETDYQTGEAAGKRNGMHVHGGRQERYVEGEGWVRIKDANLWNTGGCMRIKDDELKEIKNITQKLESEDVREKAGELKVIDDLVKHNNEFIIQNQSTSLFDNLYNLSPAGTQTFNQYLMKLFEVQDLKHQEDSLKGKIEILQKRIKEIDKKIDDIDQISKAEENKEH